MKHPKSAFRALRCAVLLAAACAGSGCVAFNMGEPDRETYEFKIGPAKATPLDRTVIDAGPVLSRKSEDDNYVVDAAVARALGLDKVVPVPAGAKTVSVPREIANRHGVSGSVSRRPAKGEELGKIDIGLAGDVELKQRTGDVYGKVTITKQNRMSFGLVPGAAEYFLRPEGSLKPMVGWEHKHGTQYEKELRSSAAMSMYGGLLATPFAILCTPFAGKYECHSHHWQGNIGVLQKLSPADREKADINVRSTKFAGLGEAAHWPWFGFHKYQTIVIGPQESGRTDTRVESERRTVRVKGPYKIEFRIPALGYRKVQTVGRDAESETFLLPSVEEDVDAEAKIRFLPAGADAGTIVDRDENAVFAAVRGKTYSRQVRLHASASTGGFAPGGVVTQIVVRPQEAPFSISKLRSKKTGRISYRVTKHDESMTAFDVDKLARPEILRELAEAYAADHPGEEADTIRAYASYVTDKTDPDVLVYAGTAFTVRPAERMEYDAETRRGSVRLRVSDHLDLKSARAWARENVGMIVSDKNIALEAGGSPPAGAKFRLLDDKLEDGILTIWFEAVD